MTPTESDMFRIRHFFSLLFLVALARPAATQIVIPPVPLNSGQSYPPLVMIVAGKDHKQFYEAYNDTTDLDGDGLIDARFNPRIVYAGLFDSKLCYRGKGVNSSGSLNSGTFNTQNDFFEPAAAVADLLTYKCTGGLWSGNFLNYVTTSRMDALRKVLYGGTRSVDSPTDTILRRAYIPKDAHGWAKEYGPEDSYNIADYAPFSRPATNKHHFFGNYTWLVSCANPATCRNAAPVLAVASDAKVGKRVWDWAASQIENLFDAPLVGATSKRYVVQVRACSAAFTLPDGTKNYRGENCKPYTNASGKTVYRPTGVLHTFGEDGAMLFGLLSGSYDSNTSGGVLRKPVGSFASEINPDTGQFTQDAKIIKTFDNMMIVGFMRDGKSSYRNLRSDNSWISDRVMYEGEFPDWGNPIGEMMYEALRYLSGEGSPTYEFSGSNPNKVDKEVGLNVASWDKPYENIPWCSKPNLLVLSDITPSFDSDQVPGARFQTCSRQTVPAPCARPGNRFTASFGSLDTGQLMDEIGQKEGVNGKRFFIGQSGSTVNWAPTAKQIDSLSLIRGLSPEEPGKEGSYTSAAIAYYGKTVGISTAGRDKQKVDTFAVVLTSPLPRIEVPTPKGTITIVPFGKSISGTKSIFIDAAADHFQPANQIVEFYIKNINPKDPANGGRYTASFLISYEDMEQGADHDMDFMVEYEVRQLADHTVEVKVTPTYQSALITMNVGYVVSGAGAQDGPYLVIQNRTKPDRGTINPTYSLNVPDGKPVGWCASAANVDTTACKTLPACRSHDSGTCDLKQSSTRIFTPSASSQVTTLLKDPLWYAAKWGGFRDRPSDSRHWPDTTAKWDRNNDGTPDNYFLVRNALGLQDALESAFNSIREGANSSGNTATTSSTFGSVETLVFSTQYSAGDWSGDLIATVLVPISTNNPTGLGAVKWQAAEQLPPANSRRIFSRSNADFSDIASQGAEFRWNDLHATQQSALSENGRLNGQEVLDYVRGSPNQESARGGSFRDRTRAGSAASPLGDSPNNAPYYFKPTRTVYFGANDGMLHAFDADTGVETFAYIPSVLIPKLPTLTHTNYGHEYTVDGEVTVATVDEGGSDAHYLVGTLGRGGKGLYGLNVTNPAAFSTRQVAWEINGPPSTAQCGSSSDLDHLGVITGAPVIAKLNDGKVYALVGNGVNSCSGRAVLYIINVRTGAITRRIDLPNTGNNGLSPPAVVDTNGDGQVDVAYAGDQKGTLWRFDLSSTNPNNWNIRFGTGANPMFVATNPGNQPQPITATPLVALDSKGTKTFVFFGTGRYLGIADKLNQDIQSWYGLIDEGTSTITRAELVRRRLTISGTATLPSGKTTTVRSVESRTNEHDMNNKRGWYIDFDVKGDEGERVINSALLIHAGRGTVVEVPSIIPVGSDPCQA
jgi:type IV pilus assembly protein PilY1